MCSSHIQSSIYLPQDTQVLHSTYGNYSSVSGTRLTAAEYLGTKMAENTTSTASHPTDVNKIQSLLKAKDDTQRFVGLALLKSLLDSSEQLRQDEQTVQGLWSSLSPKFLDRLLRTGSKPSTQNSKEMLDLAISVLYIFSILLPDQAKSDAKFIDRIPLLVNAVLYRYEAPRRQAKGTN